MPECARHWCCVLRAKARAGARSSGRAQRSEGPRCDCFGFWGRGSLWVWGRSFDAWTLILSGFRRRPALNPGGSGFLRGALLRYSLVSREIPAPPPFTLEYSRARSFFVLMGRQFRRGWLQQRRGRDDSAWRCLFWRWWIKRELIVDAKEVHRSRQLGSSFVENSKFSLVCRFFLSVSFVMPTSFLPSIHVQRLLLKRMRY